MVVNQSIITHTPSSHTLLYYYRNNVIDFIVMYPKEDGLFPLLHMDGPYQTAQEKDSKCVVVVNSIIPTLLYLLLLLRIILSMSICLILNYFILPQ